MSLRCGCQEFVIIWYGEEDGEVVVSDTSMNVPKEEWMKARDDSVIRGIRRWKVCQGS